jgi:hypothetical protein
MHTKYYHQIFSLLFIILKIIIDYIVNIIYTPANKMFHILNIKLIKLLKIMLNCFKYNIDKMIILYYIYFGLYSKKILLNFILYINHIINLSNQIIN